MIYLLAGHSLTDPGAIGVGGVKEADLTRRLRDSIVSHIQKAGYAVTIDNDAHNLSQVLAAINSTESCVICDLHFNSATPQATGVEVIIPDRSTANERMIASLMVSSLANIMKIKSRGVKSEKDTARKTLAVMREQGINLLPEFCFISNKTDLNAYLANEDKIAEIMAKHLIQAEDLIK